MLPKIHKGLRSVKGRPVISNGVTITEHISGYLDLHLNPLVSQSRSYVKDTDPFLSRLSPGEVLIYFSVRGRAAEQGIIFRILTPVQGIIFVKIGSTTGSILCPYGHF